MFGLDTDCLSYQMQDQILEYSKLLQQQRAFYSLNNHLYLYQSDSFAHELQIVSYTVVHE